MTAPFLESTQQALAAGGVPLLDFDGTAFIQFGLFVIVAVIASRLIFKPYLAMRDARDAGTEGARTEAAAMVAEADANLEDYEAKLQAARDRANDERRKVRADAAAHQRELDDKTRAEIAAATRDAEEKVTKETTAAREELLPKASTLGHSIASRLLGREVKA